MRMLLIVAVGLWAASGMTQEVEPGGYIGIGVSNFDYKETLFAGVDFSESTTGTKLYGGYRFHENWAVEGSWVTTGTLDQTETVGIAFSSTIGLDIDGFTLRAVGFLPFSWGSLFGGLGYFDADADAFLVVDDGFTVTRIDASSSEDGATVIVGVQWDFPSVSVRLEYEDWDIDQADAEQFGVGLHWRF